MSPIRIPFAPSKIRFKDGTIYKMVNDRGTLVRDPKKPRGKAQMKARKRARRS